MRIRRTGNKVWALPRVRAGTTCSTTTTIVPIVYFTGARATVLKNKNTMRPPPIYSPLFVARTSAQTEIEFDFNPSELDRGRRCVVRVFSVTTRRRGPVRTGSRWNGERTGPSWTPAIRRKWITASLSLCSPRTVGVQLNSPLALISHCWFYGDKTRSGYLSFLHVAVELVNRDQRGADCPYRHTRTGAQSIDNTAYTTPTFLFQSIIFGRFFFFNQRYSLHK